MTVPKNLYQYPKEWQDIIEKVHAKQEVKVLFPTPQMANSMKTRLYGFFKALRTYREDYEKEKLRFGLAKANEMDIEGLYSLSLLADQIVIRVNDIELEFSLRKNDAGSQILINQMGLVAKGKEILQEGIIDINDITRGAGKASYDMFKKQGPGYYDNMPLEVVPQWAYEEVKKFRETGEKEIDTMEALESSPELKAAGIDWDNLFPQAEERIDNFDTEWESASPVGKEFGSPEWIAENEPEIAQIAPDSTNNPEPIEGLRGQDLKRAKRRLRILEKRAELFGKYQKEVDKSSGKG